MFVTGGSVGLAEKIIDDTCFVILFIYLEQLQLTIGWWMAFYAQVLIHIYRTEIPKLVSERNQWEERDTRS